MYRSGMNRLDSRNIRIGLPDAQAGQAAEALGLRSIRPSRSTLHLLDYRPGSAPSSLASAGVTISVLTAATRSCRRSRCGMSGGGTYIRRWAAFYGRDAETLRVEEERDSTRRVLAASLAVRYEHAAPALAGADLRLTDLLTPRQWSFLQDCAPGPPQPGPLDLFGPIPVLSWSIRLDRIDATVSRWRLPATAGGTDLPRTWWRCHEGRSRPKPGSSTLRWPLRSADAVSIQTATSPGWKCVRLSGWRIRAARVSSHRDFPEASAARPKLP